MALGIRKPRLKYEKINMWFPDQVSFSMIRGLALARLVISLLVAQVMMTVIHLNLTFCLDDLILF